MPGTLYANVGLASVASTTLSPSKSHAYVVGAAGVVLVKLIGEPAQMMFPEAVKLGVGSAST